MDINSVTVFYDYEQKNKCHVVSVLNDEPIVQIVYKFFGKHRRKWFYEIISKDRFFLNLEYNLWGFSAERKA